MCTRLGRRNLPQADWDCALSKGTESERDSNNDLVPC